jgi:hypothetical protein
LLGIFLGAAGGFSSLVRRLSPDETDPDSHPRPPHEPA